MTSIVSNKQSNKGALINANDHFGHSPLHYAAYKGNSRFVDFLFRNGETQMLGANISPLRFTVLHGGGILRSLKFFSKMVQMLMQKPMKVKPPR